MTRSSIRSMPGVLVAGVVATLVCSPASASAQVGRASFTVADVLSPGFPYELVAARTADRIGWIEYERGMRNVYTAVPPEFRPVRLTAVADDDGNDLTTLQVSDDGTVLTFVRGHARNGDGWVANPTSDPRGAERAVWAVNTRGGRAWRVVEADDYALSPDGKAVLYAKDGQIHRAPVNPGLVGESSPAAPLFRAYGRNTNPRWSPDGSRVVFVSDRGDHAYIGVYDVGNPAVTWLAPGVDRDNAPVWSPDGRSVAFLRRPGGSFGVTLAGGRGGRGGPGGAGRGAVAAGGQRGDTTYPPGMVESRFRGGYDFSIWVADVETGEGRELWHNSPEDERFGEVRQIRWVGEHILFEAEPGNWRHWFSVSVRDPKQNPLELTPGDGIVEAASFSPDGRWLYYTSNVGDVDRRDLWRVEVGGGRPTQLTKGAGIEHYPATLASGRTVAVLYADAKRPLSVAVVPSSGGEARVITALPTPFPLDAQVAPQNATITADDGLQTHNQLFLPRNMRPGERRPALVFIHGGSRRQMLLGYHYMHFYHMAYAINQYFAAKGYIVLSINYRSGIGYGREFRTAPEVGGRGNAEYRDVIAAGRWLRERPDVDPSRIGVWGLSYGGVLTAQALARNSDVFAAGVDMAGVHLWGNSIDPESVSFRASAIAAIDSWKSPVLLMHGDDDRNVDFSQTVGLVQLLRAHDVPFELIVFPDDVHDSLLFHRWITAFEATDDFFDRALIRKEPIRVDGGAGSGARER